MEAILTKGLWHLLAGAWVTERSDIQELPEEKKCPGCNRDVKIGFNVGQLPPIYDRERELTHWQGRCLCGTELVVFND